MNKKYLDNAGLTTLANEILSHFQKKLTAGTNITIDPDTNTISASGGGSSITSINGLSGGSLTSPLVIKGGDATTSAKIALDQTQAGQITNNSTATLFGFTSNNTSNLTIGHSSYAMALRGSGTRPTYNGNSMALSSDIPTDTGATSVTTTGSGNAVTSASYDASTRTITFTKGTTFTTGTIPTQTSQLTNNSGFITTALSSITGARAGYLKFSNGLMIQWGRTARVSDNGNQTVTFSQSFSAIPSVATSSEYGADDGAWNGAYYLTEGNISSTGFKVHSRGNKNGGRFVTWIAIGYKA